ncbi:hypothetical protein [Actinomadura decatromicini]|uniref:Secreted protein n=1 Tax=Actinomadura decatromicini TaxID=2604572 RepID=A0A5D3F8H6_9ACTN|nr:hypothetical protein [Actinomadura decatromicini]TYK44379.1 hypothetical protein FXF68_33405 [Actinomadura decatromicini]
MSSLRGKARSAAVGAVAVIGLATATAAPAAATNSATITMYSARNPTNDLGWGQWWGNPEGSHQNGEIAVFDNECDGDNGIFAALYKHDGTLVNVVSVRGCTSSNVIGVKAESNGGPAWGESVTFEVCKLLPAGQKVDCQSTRRVNA